MNAEVVTLKNGLRVVLAPCEAESVAFGLFILSGSRHETDKTAGISHFIEHMLFKGTKKRSPLKITQAIEGRGGVINACTGEESTAYFVHMPFEYLREAVDIISDMYLNAAIPEGEFIRERRVVIEEIKMYEDEPDAVAMEKLQRSLFPESRLGAPVAGNAAALNGLSVADMKRYIKSHYRPDNTVAVLVGRFEREAALKSLAPLSTVSVPIVRFPSDIVSGTKPVAKSAVKKEVQQTQIALGYRTFGIADSRRYAAVVFDALMGRGMSSRLFQSVREKRGLSYDISSKMQFFDDAGMWVVSGGTDAKKADEALKVIDAEIRRISSKKVSAAELKRTKEFLIGNFRLSHERVQSKLFFYGSTMLAFNRLVDPEEQIRGIRAVTAADVLAVAKSILRKSNRSLSIVSPK